MKPHPIHRLALIAAMLTVPALSAQAAFQELDLAGWNAAGGFGQAGNTQVLLSLPAGATVTGFDYFDLRFSTTGDSWLSELVLSVNNTAVTEWLDWRPSTVEASGSFSAVSGSWNGVSGAAGPFGSTGAFTVADGSVRVTAYLAYVVPPVGIMIEQGSLRINYEVTPIPEPASALLMLLGLAGLGATAAAARRRG